MQYYIDMSATQTQIEAAIETAQDDCLEVAYRYTEDAVNVGDKLDCSYDWDSDNNDELPGTCALDELADALEYAKYSTGTIAVIAGRHAGYGELAAEVLIADAVVIATMARDNTDNDWA